MISYYGMTRRFANILQGVFFIMASQSASGATARIDSLIFDSPPIAAVADPNGPCRVIETYLGHVNARRAHEVANLFADDFVFISPTGQILKTREEVAAYYGRMVSMRPTHLVPVSLTSSGNVCVMELATRTEPEEFYRLSAMDHFTINSEGKIERLVVYVQPHSIAPFSESDMKNLHPDR